MKLHQSRTAIRNAEIVKLRSEGQTHAEIALHCGISSTRVGQILRRANRRELFVTRGGELRKAIREANDLTVKIPLDDLFCALSLSLSLATRVKDYYLKQGIQEVSLREFMDFLIPDNSSNQFKHLFDAMPAYRVHRIFKKTYSDIIKGTNHAELGDLFVKEWNGRKKMLREFLIANKYVPFYMMEGKSPVL